MKNRITTLIVLLAATTPSALAATPSATFELRARFALAMIEGAKAIPAFRNAYERKVGHYQSLFQRASVTGSRLELQDIVNEVEADLAAHPRSVSWALGSDGASEVRSAISQARSAIARGDVGAAKAIVAESARLAERFGIDL